MEENKLELERLRCEYLENPLGLAAERPRLGWTISSDMTGVIQASYRVQVSLDPEFGSLSWDSGDVESPESVRVEYGGPPLESRSRYFWRARIVAEGLGSGGAKAAEGRISEGRRVRKESPWSGTAWFEPPLNEEEWQARFVSAEGDASGPDSKGTRLRKEFVLKDKPISARIYASALGLYELSLNGLQVGDEVLAPGWTNYGKRLLFQTYDATALLRKGRNALCATVGAGWYKGFLAGWLGRRNVYGSRTALIAQLELSYADGSAETIATDATWKASDGPILSSEIYHGEAYDARLEAPGWDMPAFDDSSWRGAAVLEIKLSPLAPREGLAIRRRERFTPIRLIITPKGERVLDFGQNLSGRVRFTVTGKTGERVALRHAEVLDAEGNFYTANLRSAKARVDYTLRGGGAETYEPHFTFMGFRYICVDEWPGEIDPSAFEAVAIYSDMEETGSFTSSNELLNRLHRNIVWGLKGNFLDVPTDCPQRDERLGWTGDAQVFIGTAAFLMGTDPFFRKWLKDLAADQTDEGGVPFVVPNVLLPWKDPEGKEVPVHSATGWGDAAVICPWAMYLAYADRELLEEQYPSMRAWVELIRSRAREGLLWDSGFHFGDWVALDAKEGSYHGATPNDFLATAFYAKSAGILAKAAAVLGRSADAQKYGTLRDRIVVAFRDEFFTPSGRIAARTQTACVLALDFGLAPPEHRDRVRDTLIALIRENGGRLVTGFLGTPYICRALTDSGALGEAYDLLMREGYPSWLYQVKKGATTVWEHWDGLKPDGTMWSPDMNSFNHYAYGSIGEWLHSTVAGISADEGAPGYKRILFRPRPGGGLSFARASLMTVYGPASIEWRVEGSELKVEALVPHNACAALDVPGAAPVEFGSGRHAFSFPWPPAEARTR